jgi:hypothetical protein
MKELYIKETLDELKNLFQNSVEMDVLYPITDEQNLYVKKLNIIFGAFLYDLIKEKKLTDDSIDLIMNNIELFLQIFHLNYSEKLLSELNHNDLNYYIQNFLPNKVLNFSKSDLKGICEALKSFLSFLKENLGYYREETLFKKMISMLTPTDLVKKIHWGDKNNYFSKGNNNFNKLFESIYGYESEKTKENQGDKEVNIAFFEALKAFPNIQDENKKLKKEEEKQEFGEEINLEVDLNKWYSPKEIRVGECILKNVFKNFHNLKTLNKNGLLAAIDYSLKEIFNKKATQKEIAKRHQTSPTTLINNRHIIANSIPLEYFYPLFISEKDLKSDNEKTFIFKVKNPFKSRSYSKFELRESNTLEDLHRAIHNSIYRDDDHLYSFFMSGIEWDKSTEYAGPPEYQVEQGNRGTDIELIELNLGYKQRFLYLYDYGDCIRFDITIIGLGVYNEQKEYPFHIK